MTAATERICAACAQPLPTSARKSRKICIECEDRAITANLDAVDDLLGGTALQARLAPVDGLAFDAALRDLRASGVLRPPHVIDSSRCNRARNAPSPVPHVNAHDETRSCLVCNASLAGKRANATTCSPRCRKDLSRANRLANGCTVTGCGEPATDLDERDKPFCGEHNARRLFEKLLRRRYKRAIKAAPPDLAPYVDFIYDESLADIPRASGGYRHAQRKQDNIVDALDRFGLMLCFRKRDFEYTIKNVDAHSADAADEFKFSLDDERTADPGEPVVRKRRRCRGRPWNWHDAR